MNSIFRLYLPSILLSLAVSACYVSPRDHHRPYLNYRAKTVPVVSSVPPGCTLGGYVTGWARTSGSDRQVWIYAVNDMRNQAANSGARAVLYGRHTILAGFPYRTVKVYGRSVQCRSVRRVARSSLNLLPPPTSLGTGGLAKTPPKRTYTSRYRPRTYKKRTYTTRTYPRRTYRTTSRRTTTTRTTSRGGGKCYSDRECGGGACRSGKCTTAGGKCYSDRECPGGACRSGKCTTAGGRCYSDRECGGGVCRSGKCTTAGGKCYSDRECPGGSCRSGKCT